MSRPPAASASSTDALLRDIARLFTQAQRSLSACCPGNSTKECEALVFLHRSGPVSMQAFAAGLGLEKTWASRLADRLEASGLARRKDHPADGRSWLLTLTAKGTRQSATLDDAANDQAQALLACVPASERANVERSLLVLRDALAGCLAGRKDCGC
jgi:DNA-binding MarR family transcriptional regulator